ncbi:15-hydroxyprostaglandin dehydrogenase [NAD(+)]-like isoform X2 [Simochromis diagramma]|uniref:15-hydroxyprostaglandin dehydrogenase [NAD(+)]-like isoform X2 n=1 Tax=Simochromis diagramma TaxID=43689 RepID=UPI001A7E67C6|nr:15-hydroxyprostaglandin dehydrogenase [NAD(+)]-like isoform X2 [Simochromis diagramma]
MVPRTRCFGQSLNTGPMYCNHLNPKLQWVRVTLLDINETAGKTLKEALNKQYGEKRSLFFKCNVQSEEQIKAAFQSTVDTFGGIDIVCNNAGILNEKQWEKTVSVNVVGLIRVSYVALEYMNKLNGGKGGTIINVASVAGLTPVPSCPVYTATKHAVIGFTRAMATASSASGYGLCFNAVCPSLVKTDLFASITDNLGQFSHLLYSTQNPAVERAMNPSEVAECVFELVTGEAKNGEILMKKESMKKYMTFPTLI